MSYNSVDIKLSIIVEKNKEKLYTFDGELNYYYIKKTWVPSDNINNKSEDSCYRFPFIWLSWLVLIFLLFDLDNIWKFEITLRKVNSTFINIHSIFQTDWNLSEVDFSS